MLWRGLLTCLMGVEQSSMSRRIQATWRFLKMVDPQVTMTLSILSHTKSQSWSSMTWMIWGSPHDFRHLKINH